MRSKMATLLKYQALIFIVTSIQGYSPDDGRPLSHEKRLIKDLLRDYRRRGIYGRPVYNYSDSVKIEFGLQLIQIMDLDEKKQILTLNVWDHYVWKDEFLMWNPKKYGGVDHVRVPSSAIWRPDIKLYNYADDRLEEHRKTLAVLTHQGIVDWVPQAIYKSSCNIDIGTFPFDKQICKLKFGSWTYDGLKLDIQFYGNLSQFDLTEYMKSHEWDLLNYSAIRNVKKYSCCPEPYVDLTFTLHLQRKAAFYNYILILPCVLLTTLTLVLFWIPPESPAKMMLGMNIFVAFFVLLLLLESSLPPASSSVPIIGTYYCLNMVLITLSSFLNVIVVNFTFQGTRTVSDVPDIVKKIVFGCFARVLCMRAMVGPYMDAQKKLTRTHLLGGRGFEVVERQNKWSTDNWMGSREVINATAQPPPYPNADLSQLDLNIREIARHLKEYKERIVEKEKKDKLLRAWKTVGLVLDKLFYYIYLFIIVSSLLVVFSKLLQVK